VNHIECSTDEETYDFKQAFEAGEFKEELELSLKECAMNG
jgi:hypothetical protein